MPGYAFDVHRVYSLLGLVERVGGRFPAVHMVPAVNTWGELLGTPLKRSSQKSCKAKFAFWAFSEDERPTPHTQYP